MLRSRTPFLYIACLSGLSLIAFDLYQPALPAIIKYFHTTHELGQLTLSLYLFIFGLSQIIWGPLIDHFGRAKCLGISLLIFLFSTVFCIFSNNIYLLIAARALQSFSVCCSNVVAFSSTRDYEDTVERAKIISHISMVVSTSPIFAPLIGSVVFLYFGWQATFVCMGILGLIMLLLMKPLLKESLFWRKEQPKFSFKKSMHQYFFILKNKRLWIGVIVLAAAFTNIMIILVNITYLIMDQLHYSPTEFGLIFACNGLMMILGNIIGIKLREYFSLRWNMCLGSMLIILSSITTIILFYYQGLSLLSLTPTLVVNLGVTITNPPALSLALKDFDELSASATAIINTIRMSLSAIIAGIIGSLLTTNNYLMPFGMLVCGLLSFVFSLILKD